MDFPRARFWIGILLVLLASPALPAIRTVTNLSDSDSGSLRDTITSSVAGDTIEFAVTGTITIVSAISISHSLTVLGPRNFPLIIAGSNNGGVSYNFLLYIPSGVALTASDIAVENGGNNSFIAGISNAGTLTLTRVTISGNSGSGIVNNGTLTLSQATIVSNTRETGFGGGLVNNGTLTALNCNISRNSAGSLIAGRNGGGIYNHGTATLNNCTIAGNVAVQTAFGGGGGLGGGIYNDVTLNMTSCTVTGNSINSGVYSIGTVHPTNCIVAQNGTDITIAGGTLTNGGHNLIGNATGSTWGSSDLTGTSAAPLDPKFDPAGLAYNGGLTQTVALAADSPAIDHGVSNGLTTDQRGRNRPYDDPGTSNGNTTDGSDMGAYEVGPVPAAVTNLNDSGAGSLRDSLPDHYFGDVVTLGSSLGNVMTLNSPLFLTKDIQIVASNLLSITGSDATWVIDISSADVVIAGLIITHGSDSGIHLAGTSSRRGVLTLINCTVTNNSNSGLLATSSTDVRVYRSTFANNQALGSGGGISAAGTLSITNSTVSDNNAGNGAGIFSSAQLEIRGDTISRNTAGSNGGGVYHSSGLFSMTDSIVAGNTAPSSSPDILSTPAITASYNLVGDGSGATGLSNGVNHNQVGTTASPLDPKLDPAGLQNNGGLTQTIALLSNSPALDAGDPANLPPRDQRPFGRVGTGDIGAFEFGGRPFLLTGINIGPNINNTEYGAVTFAGLPGEFYLLQRKGSPTDPTWQDITLKTVLTAGPTSVTDFNTTLPHAFYRVLVGP